VRRELASWLDGLRSGDLGVLHYSGHGSQLPDTTPRDESDDGSDETIFLADRTQMRDDELNALLGAAAARGVRLRCFFDSCHSGSVVDLQYSYSASRTTSVVGGARAVAGDVVVVSGSQDSGTSADTVIGGRAVGALSAYLTQTLRTVATSTTGATWADVVDAVRTLLVRNRYRQVPILSASSESAIRQRASLVV
jgi:hypothetical protein